MEQEVKVKSLVKVFAILECFSNSEPELGISEISRKLGMLKSTVYNIVATCEALGYLVQNKESGKYYLGVKFLQFSYIVNNHMGLRNVFLPYMQQIANDVRETVYMGIPHGDEVLYIECCSPMPQTSQRTILGEHAPMYCTGLGKAMMAFLPEQEQKEYTSRPLEPYTETTITDSQTLLKELETIRQRGYAIDDMEHEYGVVCIGVPVFGNDGRVVAAVSVSAPSLRLKKHIIKIYAGKIQTYLQPIQNKL
ncbi:IclR family transcriptional regulator [Hungatella sp. SB206]|uniref:IclR family transcriptional regulator n=1 Tax=Hungatella sp. SB206 TaxID=2937758 RepID=UPI003DA7AFBD